MASPYVAEIMMFAGNFPPRGWATCDGQILSISQNTALFSLLGTFYGGNGQTTFALPDLQGHGPIGTGQGPGLSERFLGEEAGSSTTTLIISELPAHPHAASGKPGNFPPPANNPTNNTWGSSNDRPWGPAANLVTMSPAALSVAGSDQPHNNLMPYLVLTFCIALQGVFPPRS